ncbi:choice-of-anchor I domain-containing protein [Desulfobacter sp.]
MLKLRPNIYLSVLMLLTLTASAFATKVPVITKIADNAPIELNPIGVYESGIFDESAAEIAAYDKKNMRIYIVKATAAALDVLDIKDPAHPKKTKEIKLNKYATGINSVDVHGDLVAVAMEHRLDYRKEYKGQNHHLEGRIVFLNLEGHVLKVLNAGFLPDMVKFTPDGQYVLVANEGEPNVGVTHDPAASITIVDLTRGIKSARLKQVGFDGFDGMEVAYRNAGVRIFPLDKGFRNISNDVEPEYIAITPDSKTAYVALQENNAVAVVDVQKQKITEILPLGLKDWSKGLPEVTTFPFTNLPDLPNQAADANPVIKQGGFSALWFNGVKDNGNYEFLTVPDRGPNKPVKGSKPAQTIFPVPDYQHRIVKFEVNPQDPASGAQITGDIPLFRQDGTTPITALPNIKGWSKEQQPVDYKMDVLTDKYDAFGGDMEGLVVDKNGNFWLVDEYRPAIYHFSANGVLVNRFVPKGAAALGGDEAGTYGIENLPAVYNKRKTNRGFEAAAYDPEANLVYAFIQSPLQNPTAAAGKKSAVIRILAFSVETSTPVAEYVYFLENSKLKLKKVDKIGDATYLGKNRFGVIERDATFNDKEGKKYVFEINIKSATNTLGKTAADFGGKELEELTPDAFAKLGLRAVYKRKVLNLPSIGYHPSDKAEGLVILPDGRFAVLNDNDFAYNYTKRSLTGTPIQLGIISFTRSNAVDVIKDKKVELKNQPFFGMYMPDAIYAYAIDGKNYFVTANEGDDRGDWYEDTDFKDTAKLKKKVKLDDTAFPQGSAGQALKKESNLRTSAIDGDVDGDGKKEELHAYGARSFSIFDAYGNLVFDSGDAIERITGELIPKYFNTSNSKNKMEDRTEKKGPEPEGVTIGGINGKYYTFIGIERIGGVLVYDISNPYDPSFVQYINRRNFDVDPEEGTKNGTVGDLGPEGVLFISALESPNNKPLLVVPNEVSGTTTIYQIDVK